MKKAWMVFFLSFAAVLAGCGTQQNELLPLADQAGLAAEVPVSASESLYADLESHLRGEKTVQSTQSKAQYQTTGEGLGLSSSQILSIMTVVRISLEQANLGQSNDLAALIPVFVRAAILGVGTLQIDDESFTTQLLAAVATSVFNSVVNLDGGSAQTSDLYASLMEALVGGFPLAGVGEDQVAVTIEGILGEFLTRLGESSLGTGAWTGVLASLTSGTLLGVDQLNLPASILSVVLQSMGVGSKSGLEGLVARFPELLQGQSQSSWLTPLLQALVGGLQVSLADTVGTGNTFSSLVSSFLQGLTSATVGTGQNAGSDSSSGIDSSTAGGAASSGTGSIFAGLLNLAGSVVGLLLL